VPRPREQGTSLPRPSRTGGCLIFIGIAVFVTAFVVAVLLATETARWGLDDLAGRWTAAPGVHTDLTQSADELTIRFLEVSTVYAGDPTKVELVGTLAGERFLNVTDVSDWSVIGQELTLDDEQYWVGVEEHDGHLTVTSRSGETVTLVRDQSR